MGSTDEFQEVKLGCVVVTGTSTGIAATTTLHLARKGFHIFADVRHEKNGAVFRAQASKTLTPLIIDVTDESTISAAAGTVAEAVADRGRLGSDATP